MNIGLLVLTDEWGGAEGHVLQLARTLGERGHTATVVCLTEDIRSVSGAQPTPDSPGLPGN